MPFVNIDAPINVYQCNSVLKIVDTRTCGQNHVDSYFTEAPMVRVTIKAGYLLNEIILKTYYMIRISPFYYLFLSNISIITLSYASVGIRSPLGGSYSSFAVKADSKSSRVKPGSI